MTALTQIDLARTTPWPFHPTEILLGEQHSSAYGLCDSDWQPVKIEEAA